jgi:thioredoxin-dependent peroxiredoxin
MALKEGDKAPAFNLESDEGGTVSLKDIAADTTLVLYFYPRDNTPGCTRQAQAFTTSKKKIEAAGARVIGISRDSLKSHQSFREKCDLDITLLSDTDLAIHKAYGAWGTKTMYGKKVEGVLRTTFIIKGGKIKKIFPAVKVDGHADKVLEAIAELDSGGSGTTKTAAKKAASKKKAPPAKKKAAPKPKKKAAAKKKK